MIIKSMARKKRGSFARLVNYVKQAMTTEHLYVYGAAMRSPPTVGNVIAALEENAKFQTLRSDGNKFFHEILSLSDKDAAVPHVEQILVTLAEQYLAKRAKHGLAFFAVHLEENKNPHVHIIVAGNEYRQAKQVRCSKARFETIKRQMEREQVRQFPELRHSVTRLSHTEVVKNRVPNNKIQLRGKDKIAAIARKVQWALDNAVTWESVQALLEKEQLKLYRRGTTVAVQDMETGMRYRMKRLGLEKSFAQMVPRLNKVKQRQRQTKAASQRMRQ